MRGKGGFCLLELVPGYHMMQKPIKLLDVIITPLGEQRLRSGESTRLPDWMWPSFKSRRLRQMWVEFVIGSLPCPERFFSGYYGFAFSSKTSISKFQFDQESGRRGTTLWMCYLQIIFYLFIYFIYNSICRATWIFDWFSLWNVNDVRTSYKRRQGHNCSCKAALVLNFSSHIFCNTKEGSIMVSLIFLGLIYFVSWKSPLHSRG